MFLKKVAVVGLGYIGLPTAVTLAKKDIEVIGIDVDLSRVNQINAGISPIREIGLEKSLRDVTQSRKLTGTNSYVHADVFIVAVPTPLTSQLEADLSFLFEALENIAPLLIGGELIILESTIPPGTTQKAFNLIAELRPDLLSNETGLLFVNFAHCPERVLSGNALEEIVTNDRIIGGLTESATKEATDLFREFCDGELISTNALTAEMAKLTENSFRDLNIAFANELSVICESIGVDVWELISIANHHPRVQILQPGPGVGGHCIAVDPWFLASVNPENSKLIKTARLVNEEKPKWVINKIQEAVNKQRNQTVALLGLTFKADIDDFRESPAISIAAQIAMNNPSVDFLAVEPNIKNLPASLNHIANVEEATLTEALKKSQIIVLLVDHAEFKAIPQAELSGKELIDTRGIWRG